MIFLYASQTVAQSRNLSKRQSERGKPWFPTLNTNRRACHTLQYLVLYLFCSGFALLSFGIFMLSIPFISVSILFPPPLSLTAYSFLLYDTLALRYTLLAPTNIALKPRAFFIFTLGISTLCPSAHIPIRLNVYWWKLAVWTVY